MVRYDILNFNAFDVMYIMINRYNINGEPIKELAGVLESSWKTCGTSDLHAWTDSDRGYSYIDIPAVTWKSDRSKIQHKLCQKCIDKINSSCICGNLSEYAGVIFKNKLICPTVDSTPWFVFGIYSVDVELKGQEISLKNDCCPSRCFQETKNFKPRKH